MNDNKFFEALTGYSSLHTVSNQTKFFLVKEYMEANMPVILDNYYQYMWVECRYNSYTATMNDILDLHNLVTYLSDHREWGIKECQYKKEWPRTTKGRGSTFFCEQECKKQNIPFCHGTGTIKHPALVYLEEQCEK